MQAYLIIAFDIIMKRVLTCSLIYFMMIMMMALMILVIGFIKRSYTIPRSVPQTAL